MYVVIVTAKKTAHIHENIKWPMGTRAEDSWYQVNGLPITRHCYCTLCPDEYVGLIHVLWALRFQVRERNLWGPKWQERTDHRDVKAVKQDHGSSDGTPIAPRSHPVGCTHAIGIQMPTDQGGDLCFIFVLDSSVQKLLYHSLTVWGPLYSILRAYSAMYPHSNLHNQEELTNTLKQRSIYVKSYEPYHRCAGWMIKCRKEGKKKGKKQKRKKNWFQKHERALWGGKNTKKMKTEK